MALRQKFPTDHGELNQLVPFEILIVDPSLVIAQLANQIIATGDRGATQEDVGLDLQLSDLRPRAAIGLLWHPPQAGIAYMQKAFLP